MTTESTKGNERCLVLLSGGIDSSAALYFMRTSGYTVEGLFIDYKHKARDREMASAAQQAHHLDCLLHVMTDPLDQQFFIDAKPFDPPISHETERLKEARLDIMLCLSHWLVLASIYCLYFGIDNVVLGITASDSHRVPWVRRNFVDKIGEAVYNWAGSGPKVLLPFLTMEKKDIVRIGSQLGVPFDKTWSCLEQGQVHCGICEGCKMRQRAFSKSGIVDSMEYEMNA